MCWSSLVQHGDVIVDTRHLGQREEFLPTNRGFDSYLGVPYSVDMGSTAWDLDPDAPNISLPLLNGTTIIQQPVDLNLLTSMYIEEASSVIKSSVQADQPFFLCPMAD